MKLLFVHGGEKLKVDNEGNYYTGGSYNKEVWNRYLSVFNEMTFLARMDSQKYKKEYAMKHFNKFEIEVINFINVPNILSSYSSFLNIKLRKKRNKIIERAVLEHDYLIARIPSDEGYIAVKYAKKYNKPYLLEVVGCVWDSLWNYSFSGKLLAPSKFLTMKKMVKNAPYAIYVTNKFLQGRYPTNGKSTNCSNVALSEFDKSIINKRIEKINRLDFNKKLIIGTTAAVDVKYKGQQYVIEALGRLKKQGITHLEYQLVGGGDKSYLESLAIKYDVFDQVKFLGTKSHNEVFEWLDSIDIYVQPSRQEGLPRALVEAMSRGLPAFGAKTGGIPELIDPNYIFSNTKKNIEEICRIILLFINNKEVMKNQAKRNYLESKKYDRDLIEKRRRIFFEKFRNNGK